MGYVLLLTTFAVCFGSSSLIGYNLGVVNLPGDLIKAYMKDAWKLNDNQLEVSYGQVSGVFVIAAAIGAFSCGWVADGLGRRNSLMLNNIIGIIGALMCAPCVKTKQPGLLFGGRFLSGLNSGITIGVASLYLTEIAPLNLRGFIGACHQLAVTMGIVISYCATIKQAFNTDTLWPLAIAIGAIPPAVSCFLLPMCPESPRYLYLIKNREEDAKKAYARLNPEGVDMFTAEMREEAEAAKKQPEFKFMQLFKQPDLRLPVAIAVLIQVLQQLSGINAWTHTIAYTRLDEPRQIWSASVKEAQIQYFVMAIGVLNVVCTIVALPLLERAGRRTLLLWPTFVLGVTLLLLTVMVCILDSKPENQKEPYAVGCVVLLFIYIACFAVGLGPIPALIVAELFRQGPRTAAYSLSQSVQWLCNLMVLLTFPVLNKTMKGYVYLPFFGVVVVCWMFFFVFMPETKNKTFDEIAKAFASNSNVSNSAQYYRSGSKRPTLLSRFE
ncbi:unnamed protein product [Schistocephalus solidus]|uniref:Glucose transporter type 1 n=1 Tax=Schistocephalus solidus TaxID=70667 RepID=A0A183TGL9_SCHSO|nr:unnamed protein product [Schistocephalus solidus]